MYLFVLGYLQADKFKLKTNRKQSDWGGSSFIRPAFIGKYADEFEDSIRLTIDEFQKRTFNLAPIKGALSV